jgi:hyperosmotically inducible periplasmic protein
MKMNPMLIKTVGSSALLLLMAHSAYAVDVGGTVNAVTTAVSDTGLTGSVKAKIAADARLKGSDISVTTNNGVTVLTGTAPSHEAKVAAEEQAKSVAGVTKVDNQIKAPSLVADVAADVKTDVKAGAATTTRVVSDSWITTKVKSQLLADETTKGTTIKVKTQGKVVHLSGTASSDAEKAQAIKLATATEGVTKVDASHLKVVAKAEAN